LRLMKAKLAFGHDHAQLTELRRELARIRGKEILDTQTGIQHIGRESKDSGKKSLRRLENS